jgi:hypothetical protein
VLPGPSHPAFRMSGEFSPTRPLPTTNSQAEIQAVVGEQLGDEYRLSSFQSVGSRSANWPH